MTTDTTPLLQDKVALVTGAGRGIGRACALALAGEGAHLVLLARSQAELEVTAEQVRALQAKALVVVADVIRYEDCQQAAETAAKTFGGIDILVSNAGSEMSAKVIDADPAAWANIIDVNLTGSFNMTRAVLPGMVTGGGGRIVMLGSGAGHSPAVGLSAYGAAKAGLSYLTKVLAQEVWSAGVDINEVVPGPVATKLTESFFTLGETPRHLPSERVKGPEEVAELVLWLCQRPAGGPTGQVFSLARRPL